MGKKSNFVFSYDRYYSNYEEEEEEEEDDEYYYEDGEGEEYEEEEEEEEIRWRLNISRKITKVKNLFFFKGPWLPLSAAAPRNRGSSSSNNSSSNSLDSASAPVGAGA